MPDTEYGGSVMTQKDVKVLRAAAMRRLHGGAALISKERERQVAEEGWTPEHDLNHAPGALTDAAISYAMAANGVAHFAKLHYWPWDEEFWKPSDDQIRNLVKAGALIAAEIDRLQATK